jgi:hypothetical protein
LTGKWTGGSLETSGVVAGRGVLNIYESTRVTLLATLKAVSQAVDLTGSLGTTATDTVTLNGSLTMKSGSTLAIVAAKKLVVAAGTTADNVLSLSSGGAISLPAATTITLSAEGTFKATLAIKTGAAGSISGLAVADPVTDLANVGEKGVAGTTYNSPNLVINVATTDGGGTAGTNAAAVAAVGGYVGGVITITGGTGGSTLNNSGSIIRIN